MSHIHSILLLSLFLAGTLLLTYVVMLILAPILIWGPALSHTYNCPVVGLPITISQCLTGNTREQPSGINQTYLMFVCSHIKQRWNKVQIWSRLSNGSVKVTYSLYSLDFTDKVMLQFQTLKMSNVSPVAT